MTIPIPAPEVLDREFLVVRAKILEIAAALDRIDRAAGDVDGDRRADLLREGLAVLVGDEANRAERVQMIFSLPYDERWRKTLAVSRPR
jgi:hypothetical protein